jgi:hypothetical protein
LQVFRGITVARMLLALTDTKRVTKVQQFFPVRGHSFLPCDRDFAIIKRALKRHDRIYSIQELTNIIIESSKNRKFTVKVVESEEIIEFKKWWPKNYKKNCISQETKSKTGPKEKKVNFLISKCMHFTYDSTIESQIVTRQFIDSALTHTFRLKSGNANIKLPDQKAFSLKKVPIKASKVKDIEKLMPYTPHEFVDFYREVLA